MPSNMHGVLKNLTLAQIMEQSEEVGMWFKINFHSCLLGNEGQGKWYHNYRGSYHIAWSERCISQMP